MKDLLFVITFSLAWVSVNCIPLLASPAQALLSVQNSAASAAWVDLAASGDLDIFNLGFAADTIQAHEITADQTGYATKIRFYVGTYFGATDIKAALYAGGGGGALLGDGIEAIGATGYTEITLRPPVSVTASTAYEMAFMCSTATNIFMAYDSTTTGSLDTHISKTYSSFPYDPAETSPTFPNQATWPGWGFYIDPDVWEQVEDDAGTFTQVVGDVAGTTYLAFSFTADNTGTLQQVKAHLRENGTDDSGTDTFDFAIYDDNAGEPGSALTNGTISAISLNDLPNAYEDHYFYDAGFSPSLTSGSTYWQVYKCNTISATENISIRCEQSSGTEAIYEGDATPTWSSIDETATSRSTLWGN